MGKLVKKVADKALGVPMRSALRNFIVNPFLRLNYKVTIIGEEDAFSCSDGAIVVSNHISQLDAPLIMSEAWPHARVWPTAWHREYNSPLQWPVMKLFATVSLGSPSNLPEEVRAERKRKAMDIMHRILRAGRHLLVFAEGGIGDGSRVEVKRHLSGVFELIKAYPEKPLLMVSIKGLEVSAFGKVKRPWYQRLNPRRLPVSIEIKRFDNVSLEGGHPGLNERIEKYYNEGIPLSTAQ